MIFCLLFILFTVPQAHYSHAPCCDLAPLQVPSILSNSAPSVTFHIWSLSHFPLVLHSIWTCQSHFWHSQLSQSFSSSTLYHFSLIFFPFNFSNLIFSHFMCLKTFKTCLLMSIYYSLESKYLTSFSIERILNCIWHRGNTL